MFSPALLDRLATKKPLAIDGLRGVTVSAALHQTYRRALEDRPHEYIFKNEIANQIFLARYNPDRNALLTEFRVRKARLDVVIANGTTTCYEIKTDRDELRRLDAQLEAASLVFDKIFLVTTERFAAQLMSCDVLPPHVGVYILDSSAKLRRKRNAITNSNDIAVDAVFDCLRQSEYIPAIHRRFGFVPKVPNTRLYDACKNLFLQLGPNEAHKIFTESLKLRAVRIGDRSACDRVPYEARLLYLDADPRKRPKYAKADLYQQLTQE